MTHSSQPQWQKSLAWAAGLVFWFALVLQLVLSLKLTYARGGGTLRALWVYFAYFTILTNLLAAVALAAPLVASRTQAAAFFRRRGTITAIATYMLLVGITYNLLLRNVWQPQGWQLVADVLLHSVNPILFLAYWWSTGSDSTVDTPTYAAIVRWALYPLTYFVYAVARGLSGDFYTYPFIDVGTLGFPRVLLNAVAISMGFALVAAMLVALTRWRASRQVRA